MIQTADRAMDMAQLFSSGHPTAFQYFFDTLSGPLKYYAFRILNDKPTAEDAVSSAFEKIYNNRHTLGHPAVIKSWLYTTTRNECLNRLQKTKVEDKGKDRLGHFLSLDFEESPEERITTKEQLEEIMGYMNELPHACKKIFTLLYREGKKVSEVAADLEIAISTVKNQKLRGLGIIKGLMKEAEEKEAENAKLAASLPEEPVKETFVPKPKPEPRPKPEPVVSKSYIELIQEGDGKAWNKLFADHYMDFIDMFQKKAKAVSIEITVDDAFQRVRNDGFTRRTIKHYLGAVRNAVEASIILSRREAKKRLRSPKQEEKRILSMIKPVQIIKPMRPTFQTHTLMRKQK